MRRASPAQFQTSISNQSGAKKGRDLGGRQGRIQSETITGIGQHVVCIPAIKMVTMEAGSSTEIFSVRQTEFTLAARPSEPRDADPLTDRDDRLLARGRDFTDDLMPGDNRIVYIRQFGILNM